MKDDDLDRILSGDEDIFPSSGFTDSVMEAVRCEASTPPAIPFPWKRAWPGLVVGALALVAALVASFVLPAGTVVPDKTETWTPGLVAILEAGEQTRIDLIVLALLLTFGALALSARLASRRDGLRRTDRGRAS